MVILRAKVKTLEKSNWAGHRDIQIQTEELNGEPTSALRYKTREEQPNVFRQQPTLIYPVTLQELPNGRDSLTANCSPVSMLDLRILKEAIISCGMHSPF